MSNKFTIEISGSGFEYGVGRISKIQYKYWSEREGELADALNNRYDYKENKTPKLCVLKNYYNEYDDIASFSGPLIEESIIKIISQDGQILFNADPYKLAENFEYEEDFIESGEEFHSWNGYDLEGHFIKWRLDGHGIYFSGELKDVDFHIEKLKIVLLDIDNERIIHDVIYKNKSIENLGGDSFYKGSDFVVGYNKSAT